MEFELNQSALSDSRLFESGKENFLKVETRISEMIFLAALQLIRAKSIWQRINVRRRWLAAAVTGKMHARKPLS